MLRREMMQSAGQPDGHTDRQLAAWVSQDILTLVGTTVPSHWIHELTFLPNLPFGGYI